MRHAFVVVAVVALAYALMALFERCMAEFVIAIALFVVAASLDLRVHRRGPHRERAAILLFTAAIAIAVTGVLAQVGVNA